MNNKDKIKESNFDVIRYRNQIDGNTLLHEFINDREALNIILENYIDEEPEYLNDIFIKNNDNKTPLDLAIEMKNQSIIDLLILKVITLNKTNANSLQYSDFIMKLESNFLILYAYFEDCYFKTIQMNNLKNLNLKLRNQKCYYTHNSWIIDRGFIEKNWTKLKDYEPIKDNEDIINNEETKVNKNNDSVDDDNSLNELNHVIANQNQVNQSKNNNEFDLN